jgi:hypothetical protein
MDHHGIGIEADHKQVLRKGAQQLQAATRGCKDQVVPVVRAVSVNADAVLLPRPGKDQTVPADMVGMVFAQERNVALFQKEDLVHIVIVRAVVLLGLVGFDAVIVKERIVFVFGLELYAHGMAPPFASL